MNSYDYDSLCQTINKMPAWQTVALCAACAEKVTPIIHEIGLPSTWGLVQDCLEHVWSSLGQRIDQGTGLALIEALHSTPEWKCDDLAHLPFIVTKALDFINFALLASISSSSAEQAEQALSLLLEVTENFDTAASQFPAPQIVSALNIQLVKNEQSSQQRLVASLENIGTFSRDVIGNLRSEALTISDSMKKMLPIYAYYYLHG